MVRRRDEPRFDDRRYDAVTDLLKSRPADAVLVPRGYSRAARSVDQHRTLNRWFGPVCDCLCFWWSQTSTGNLGTPRTSIANHVAELAGRTLYFESWHPMAGRSRYDWFRLAPGEDRGAWSLAEALAGPDEFPSEPRAGFLVKDRPAENDHSLIVAARDYHLARAAHMKTVLNTILGDPVFREMLRAAKPDITDEDLEDLAKINAHVIV